MKALVAETTARLKSLFPRRSFVGIDPGSYAIKAMHAEPQSGGFAIKECWLMRRSEATAVDALRTALKPKGKGGVLSIADEEIESHEFKLPKLTKKELQTAIDWEIKKAVASPDYVFHDVLAFESAQGYEVQCVVASKDVVKSRYTDAQSFGVEPKALETESSALLACAEVCHPGRRLHRVAILDLGHSSFRLIFLHEGRVSFTRSLYFGLSTLCHQAAQQLNLPPDDVITVFKTLSAEPSAAPTPAERYLQESLYTLCEEFRRSEFFAKDSKSLEEIEEIFLCGGGACIPAAVSYLGRHLSEKKTSVLDPFARAGALPTGVDPTSGPIWACALGLSLRGSV